MLIEIVKVGIPEVVPTDRGGSYKKLGVVFKKEDDSEPKTQNIVSFKNPTVFKALEQASPGNLFKVKVVKEGNFWNWASVDPIEKGQEAALLKTRSPEKEDSSTKPTGRVTGSTYETPEERAAKQVYIVRQSSLATAIQFFNLQDNKTADEEDVIQLASKFENYVFNGTTPVIIDKVKDLVETKRGRAKKESVAKPAEVE